MRSNGQDRPSETERLRARVNRLEMRLERLNGDAPSDVAAASGVFVMLTASAVLGWAAYRSWHEDHVVSRSSRHS